jgi:hypothetical protein
MAMSRISYTEPTVVGVKTGATPHHRARIIAIDVRCNSELGEGKLQEYTILGVIAGVEIKNEWNIGS